MDLFFEIIGYIGSIFVLTSMMMTSLKWLRIANMLGSLMSIIYSLYFGAYPILTLNIALIIINTVKLVRAQRAARANEKTVTEA